MVSITGLGTGSTQTHDGSPSSLPKGRDLGMWGFPEKGWQSLRERQMVRGKDIAGPGAEKRTAYGGTVLSPSPPRV